MSEEMRNALARGYEIEGYRIEKVLGAGGFGVTYLAHEIAINRKVAIKEYLPNGIATRGRDDISVHPLSESDRDNFQWGLDRFRQEAKTLVTFRHTNIVTVYRYFEANGTAYLVMAYEDGESLAKILERAGTLSEGEITEILDPLLSGLEHVHSVGFLHRDIKPGNIYIRRDGSPVLLDFGAARHAMGGRSQSLTSIVSAGYAPFEQYTTRGNQGPWTDIYAFGGVLYRALVGERPPDAPDRIRNDPYVPAARIAKGKASDALLAAIDAALEVDEAKRPQSVRAWRAMIAGEHAPTRPPFAQYSGTRGGDSAATLPTGMAPSAQRPTGHAPVLSRADNRTEPPRKSRAGLWAAVIIGALVLVGGAGAGVYFYLGSQTESETLALVNRARGAISTGSFDEADRLLSQAEQKQRNHPEIAKAKNELEAARQRARDLEREKQKKIIEARGLLIRARAAIARRAYDEAEGYIEQAARLAPDLPEIATVRQLLADARNQARDTAAKAEQVRKLIAQAREAIRAKNFDEAQGYLDEAAKILPNDPDLAAARTELANARRGTSDSTTLDRLLEEARDAITRKDFATARRKLDEAARISPNDPALAALRRQLAEAEKGSDHGDRTPVPGVTKSPMGMCQPGSMRFVEATRKLPIAGARYCSTREWAVREVTTNGTQLFWRVIFNDGYVSCQCNRTGSR